jgi:WS/DGAT/MGAT family acyltransferase
LTVWSRAYINNLKRPVKLLETVGGMVPRAIRASRESRGNEVEHTAALVKTRFNDRISSYRVTDAIVLDLDNVKQIKSAVPGSTVNDVIVSVVGGGLRKYLQAKDELPAGSLTCGAPINVRPERNSDSIGNQVGIMTIEMATDVDDALERLQSVADHTRESKAYSSAIGASAMMDISKGLWPQVTGAAIRLATLAAVTSDIPMPVHTVVSNVPGPQVPLYLAGARMHMIMGIGPVLDMMGLFHGVISGGGKITINFVSCREMLPDPGFYRECLQQAYEELESATVGRKSVRKRKTRSA